MKILESNLSSIDSSVELSFGLIKVKASRSNESFVIEGSKRLLLMVSDGSPLEGSQMIRDTIIKYNAGLHDGALELHVQAHRMEKTCG